MIIIQGGYNTGDAVTNIRGHLELINGVLQLVPASSDWGAPNSSGNTPIPPSVTITELLANVNNYESEFVKILGVTFAEGINFNTFSLFTDYGISDGASTIFRTAFNNADYIGTTIPQQPDLYNIVAIVSEENGTVYVTARDLGDFEASILSSDNFELDSFKLYPNPTSLGYITLSSRNNVKMDVSIFSVLGKQIINEAIINNRLNVSNLKSGVYIMKISQDNTTITKKLVIK